eukprot:COSAG01_NODE_1152_length_11492_cov_12.314842_1_plen_68_part_00
MLRGTYNLLEGLRRTTKVMICMLGCVIRRSSSCSTGLSTDPHYLSSARIHLNHPSLLRARHIITRQV